MPLFQNVLVANRGEIARRVIRTCKRLGLRTTAIYSEADRDAPHVKEADLAILVGAAAPRASYLDMEKVLGAVKESGADAVHPGYGFLSENSEFARRVAAAGAVFVGPPPEVLDAFGDKMKARHVAVDAGAEPVPGTVDPLPMATEADFDGARLEAERVGYPLLVKAVGGGGGIGMQLVQNADGLERAMRSCSDRGKAAFADERVYLERYIDSPRHIEVQVLCDSHGQAFALGERECSIQRRHQKIVEESPSPAQFFEGADGQARRDKLFDAALRIVKHVGYVGAGTCEFIADGAGNLYFLEVNARLQVEHPATEMVTGLDLVELQLRVAAGEKLEDLSAVRPHGHAIEARIYAEDPYKGFIPKPGNIEVLEWAGDHGDAQTKELRIEAGVVAPATITPFYDPMIAKVVAWGETRQRAIARLSDALDKTRLEPCVTNRAFLVDLLGSEVFQSGTYTTLFAMEFAKANKPKPA